MPEHAHPSNIRIRPFREDDLNTLFEIDQTCFPSGIAYSKKELARFISRRGASCWVAEDTHKIVGFLIAEREPRAIGHIVTIDVVEDKRRSGVGYALMERLESWATSQKLQMLYLEAAVDNLQALRFYERRDFIKLEKINDYYGKGSGAWVMIKRLRAG